eukprot:scaffold3245_cov181-Skeletonema_menzelii.AAC.4
MEETMQFKKLTKKRRRKICSADGCTNIANKKGGVCFMHGAAVKLCSYEGCTNQIVKGGVCKRHGAQPKLLMQH